MVKNITETLMPHFQLSVLELNETKFVRTSKWLPDFENTLTQAINKALLLKARIAVAPADCLYTLTWYAPGSSFDRALMKELHEAPADRSGLKVAVTLFPGWTKGDGVVVTRAHVKLDVLKGEI